MSESTAPRWLLAVVVALSSTMGAALGLTVAEPDSPPAELIWCCDGTDGGCQAVEFMADCPGGSYLYVCEWGRSTEASGADGESGWECLEQ